MIIKIILSLIMGGLLASGSLINTAEDTYESEIGFEYLDIFGNKTSRNEAVFLHIWNTEDDYYFNASSGIQFSNHFNEFWTKNIFCAGYKTDKWHYDCNDELPFTWNEKTDNLTYVNITGWRDKTIGNKKVRLAIRYHLKLDDENLSVQFSVKNIGKFDINNDLGFAWRVKDIKIANTTENDIIRIWNNSVPDEYNLSDDLHLSFTNLNESKYEMLDSLKNQFIRLNWNNNLNYKLMIDSTPTQDNAPTTLAINIGSLAVEQTKKTTMYWKDPVFMAWDITTPTGVTEGADFSILIEGDYVGDIRVEGTMTFQHDPQQGGCNAATPVLETCGDGIQGISWTIIDNTGCLGCQVVDYNTIKYKCRPPDGICNVLINVHACAGSEGDWEIATETTTIQGDAKDDCNNDLVIGPPDLNYPIFSDYWDDNASLIDSGTGHFNVTVDSTNGTVQLDINGENITATNLTANVYNASYTFSSSGTYVYTWNSWGNGTATNYNVSNKQSYTVNESDTTAPNITFEPPTPEDESTQSNDNIFVNVSASDSNNISTFIDFDNSLVSWWRMDDVSGSTLTDYMGRHDGTITEAVQTNGVFGKGMEFDGINDYVNLASPSGLDNLHYNNFTISAWTYDKYDTTTTTWGTIYGSYVSGGLAYRIFSNDSGARFMNLEISTTGTSVKYQSDSGTIIPFKWQHLVLVFNKDMTAKFYIDGEEVVYQQQTQGTGTINNDASKNKWIGRLPHAGGVQPWNGTIDDVMIFNRSLSAEEIQGLYANKSSEYLTHNYTSLAEGSHTFKAYTQDLAGNVNGTETRTVTISADTCTAPASGHWTIECSDNCIFDTNQVVPANVTINGAGVLTLNANWTFTSPRHYIIADKDCQLMIKKGQKWL